MIGLTFNRVAEIHYDSPKTSRSKSALREGRVQLLAGGVGNPGGPSLCGWSTWAQEAGENTPNTEG